MFCEKDSRRVRTFAHFLRPEGPGETRILPATADSCSILSVRNCAGALSTTVHQLAAFIAGTPFLRSVPVSTSSWFECWPYISYRLAGCFYFPLHFSPRFRSSINFVARHVENQNSACRESQSALDCGFKHRLRHDFEQPIVRFFRTNSNLTKGQIRPELKALFGQKNKCLSGREFFALHSAAIRIMLRIFA